MLCTNFQFSHHCKKHSIQSMSKYYLKNEGTLYWEHWMKTHENESLNPCYKNVLFSSKNINLACFMTWHEFLNSRYLVPLISRARTAKMCISTYQIWFHGKKRIRFSGCKLRSSNSAMGWSENAMLSYNSSWKNGFEFTRRAWVLDKT